MEEETFSKRRNSIERYKPKQSMKDLTNGVNDLNLSENSYTEKGHRKRAVNNHLYSDKNHGQNYQRVRGRGRGRGRGIDFPQKNEEKPRHNYKVDDVDHENTKSKWNQQGNTMKFNINTDSDRPYSSKHDNIDPISKKPLIKKNTETFKPSHKPSDMRILSAHAGWKRYLREMTSRDVLIVHDLFCTPDDLRIYEKLLNEIKNSGIDENNLWQLWHGDSHVIADDKKRWKDSCPTFHMVLEKIQDYFQMDIKATRLNWYRDSNEWKPFHHDAAALKPDKARTQNLTVAVSFGAERDAAFEHATTKTVISMPQPNGTIYTFGKDVNIIWRHGILQVPPEKYHNRGRISIIAWGWAEQIQI